MKITFGTLAVFLRLVVFGPWLNIFLFEFLDELV